MTTLQPYVDIELVCHFGSVENIDVYEIGHYFIQVELFFRNDPVKKIVPNRCFSAPSTLGSFVKSSKISAVPILQICDISDELGTFRSRSFLIRYRNETHELNEGCHYKFSCSNIKVDDLSDKVNSNNDASGSKKSLIHCNHDLILQFRLFKSDYDDQQTQQDQNWIEVSEQSFVIHKPSSGIHEYFPVNFKHDYYLNLECMIHCAITSVHYSSVTYSISNSDPNIFPFYDNSLPITVINTMNLNIIPDRASYDINSIVHTNKESIHALLECSTKESITVTNNQDSLDSTSNITIHSLEFSPDYFPKCDSSFLSYQNDNISYAESNDHNQPPTNPLKESSQNYPSESLNPAVLPNSNFSIPKSDDDSTIESSTVYRDSDSGRSTPKSMSPDPTSNPTPTSRSFLRPLLKSHTPKKIQTPDVRDHSHSNRGSLSPTEYKPSISEFKSIDDTPLNLTSQSNSTTDSNTFKLLNPKLAIPSSDLSPSHSPLRSYVMNSPSSSKTKTLKLENSVVKKELTPQTDDDHDEIDPIDDLYQDIEEMSDIEDDYISDGDSVEVFDRKQMLLQRRQSEGIKESNSSSTFATEETPVLSLTLEEVSLFVDTYASNMRCNYYTVKSFLYSLMQGGYLIDSEAIENLRRTLDSNDNSSERFSIATDEESRPGSGGSSKLNLYGTNNHSDSMVQSKKSDRPHHQRRKSSLNHYLNEVNVWEQCVFDLTNIILQDMLYAQTLSDLEFLLTEKINFCNWQISILWFNFVSNLPRLTSQLLSSMKPIYDKKMKYFWSRQMIVHTCGLQYAWMAFPNEDQLVNLILERLQNENRLCRQSDSNLNLIYSNPINSNFRVGTSKRFRARGLKIYDPKIHEDLDAIPIIALQQYTYSHSSSRVAVRGGSLMDCGVYFPGSYKYPSFLDQLNQDELLIQTTNDSHSGRHHLDNSVFYDSEDTLTIPKKVSSGLFGLFSSASYSPKQSPMNSRSNSPVRTGESTPSSARPSKPITLKDNEEASTFLPSSDPHLIVLQHGFLGCSYDMRFIQHALMTSFPMTKLYILNASKNNDSNDVSIERMAFNLATEVDAYIYDYLPEFFEDDKAGKVSFIGHSLVIRKALESPNLAFLKSRCHILLTLATPHLGTAFLDSNLVATGMWAMFQMKKFDALKELSLQDCTMISPNEVDYSSCLLHKLACNGTMSNFKRVILISSMKDMYVPRYSASLRINLCQPNDNSPLKKAIRTMNDNLIAQMDPDRIIRITLDNNISKDEILSMNAAIGRTAHICYLDDPRVATVIINCLYPYFAM